MLIGLAICSSFVEMSTMQTAAVPSFSDGMAQVVPAFSDQKEWIREFLWVETEFDSDEDGKKDRVFVNVTRQKQTESEGLKVPVIYHSSPYFAGTSDGVSDLWDVRQELGDPPPPRTQHPNVKYDPNRTVISRSFTREWIPRGFAVVHSEAPGTGRSNGAVTIGGVPERFAPKAVIDWLCGRAKGYTSIDGTQEVFAKWCSGKVGMMGTSYEGTLPIAAATTGVKGLEAIIPVSPNTSYYHYYRSNGLVRSPGGYLGEDIDSLFDFVSSGDPALRPRGIQLYRDGLFAANQDRRTGDYNPFWADRDLLRFAKNIKCAVLMAHGFNDWNVVPEHAARISAAVKGRVPLIQYFHQGGHGGDPPFDLQNKWFTRFLYGVKNGVENGPKALIVRENEGKRNMPTPYAEYPNPDAKDVVLFPGGDGLSIGSLNAIRSDKAEKLEFTDDVSQSTASMAMASASPNRLLFASSELKAPLHISGTPKVTLRLASSARAANLSVYLVQLPWVDRGPILGNLITRGWADPQNHAGLRKGGNFGTFEKGVPLKPGEFVNMSFDLQPDDQIIPAGRKVGLMIFSSDREFTLWPRPGTKLTVDVTGTRLTLPVVGGAVGLKHSMQ